MAAMARNTVLLLVLAAVVVQLVSVVPPAAAGRAPAIQQPVPGGGVPNGGTRRFLGIDIAKYWCVVTLYWPRPPGKVSLIHDTCMSRTGSSATEAKPSVPREKAATNGTNIVNMGDGGSRRDDAGGAAAAKTIP
ncbi:hypothetical protein ACP70R_003780 [Stipagrostis hirtigluma subsp. patula]